MEIEIISSKRNDQEQDLNTYFLKVKNYNLFVDRLMRFDNVLLPCRSRQQL